MFRRLTVLSAFWLAGCASAELNYNTLDIAQSTNDLMMAQVYYNLSNFIDSDLAYPAQVVIGTGTASTTDTATATISTPLTSAVTSTFQAVGTVAAPLSGATTNIRTGTVAGASAGPSLSAQRSQNWAYAPVTDAFQATRLMALYRFIIDQDPDELRKNYRLIAKSITLSNNECINDAAGKGQLTLTLPATSKAQGVASGDNSALQRAATASATAAQAAATAASAASKASTADEAKKQADAASEAAKKSADATKQAIQAQANLQKNVRTVTHCVTSFQGNTTAEGDSIAGGTETESQMIRDEYYLMRPNCVLCWPLYSKGRGLVPNEALTGHWLHWRALPGASGVRPDTFVAGDTPLGRYGHYDLFAAKGFEKRVPQFAVFVLAAETQSDSGGPSGGAGGGGGGGGGSGQKSRLSPQLATFQINCAPGGPNTGLCNFISPQ